MRSLSEAVSENGTIIPAHRDAIPQAKDFADGKNHKRDNLREAEGTR